MKLSIFTKEVPPNGKDYSDYVLKAMMADGEVRKLDHDTYQLAKPGEIDNDFWKFPDYPDSENDNPRGRLAPITQQFGSSVRLVPNNSSDIAYDYELKQVYETLFLDSYGEANSSLRAIVFEYAMRRE